MHDRPCIASGGNRAIRSKIDLHFGNIPRDLFA